MGNGISTGVPLFLEDKSKIEEIIMYSSKSVKSSPFEGTSLFHICGKSLPTYEKGLSGWKSFLTKSHVLTSLPAKSEIKPKSSSIEPAKKTSKPTIQSSGKKEQTHNKIEEIRPSLQRIKLGKEPKIMESVPTKEVVKPPLVPAPKVESPFEKDPENVSASQVQSRLDKELAEMKAGREKVKEKKEKVVEEGNGSFKMPTKEELFSTYLPYIVKKVYPIIKSKRERFSDTEDVLQNLYARILDNWEEYRSFVFNGKSGFLGWLIKLATFENVNEHRRQVGQSKKGPRKTIPISELSGGEQEFNPLEHDFDSEGNRVRQGTKWELTENKDISDMEVQEVLKNAINSLTEREKTVILMSLQIDPDTGKKVKNEKIAQSLGVSLHDVKNWKFHAMKKLKEDPSLSKYMGKVK